MSSSISVPDKDLNLIPTLLIGCGGTGKETLLRIRKMFYEKGMGIGEKSAIVDYLVLDTDAAALDNLGDSSLTPHMKNILSFSRAGETPEAMDISVKSAIAQNYLQGGKKRFSNIFSWFNPDLLSGDGGSMISAGAGQNRQIGRLCFFHNYSVIKKVLENKFNRLVGLATNVGAWLQRGTKVEENSLNVCIVTSIAGGTGSGIFLDVAMEVRRLLDTTFARFNGNITIYAVLPESYLQYSKNPELEKKMKENAFAALSEMEYFAYDKKQQRFDLSFPPALNQNDDNYDRSVFEVEWEQGEKHKVRARFWSNCYLVGGTNDEQASPLAPDQITQMLAEAIFLDFDETAFGMKMRSNRVNQYQHTLGLITDPVKDKNGGLLYERSFTKAFSIFGLSQIYFDRAKIRRAAAYRLAFNLVNDYWLRRTATLPGAIITKSIKDTGEAALNNSEVTNTRLLGDPVISIGYDALEKYILIEVVDRQTTWIDSLKAEARTLRQKIELEEFDSLVDSPIEEFISKHELMLEKNKRSVDSGRVTREVEQRRIQLEKEVKNRINSLVRFRVKENGLVETEELIKEYNFFINRLEITAKEISEYPPPDLGPWQNRIHDARMIPIKRYAKIAAKNEMSKAVANAFEGMRWGYLKSAAWEINKIINLLKKDLSESSNTESYLVSIRRFSDLLANKSSGVLSYLEKRCAELQRKNDAYGLNARTIGLLGDVKEEETDRDLMRLFAENNEEKWNYEKIEQLLIEKLKAAGIDWARKVTDFGDIVLTICPLSEIQGPPRHKIEEFAEEIALACDSILIDKGFGAKVKALDQFFQEKADDQVNCMKIFRRYASPFLTINSRAVSAIEKSRQNNDVIYLGISDTASENAEKFRDKLKRASNKAKPLDGMQSFQMRDDTIVLYIDRVGVPLCLYEKLDDLGSVYDKSTRKKDCHIDYPFLRYKLPEIRLIDQTSHDKNEKALEVVLQGIMMDLIPYDKESNGFKYHSGSSMLSFPIGGNLEEVVNYFVDSPTNLEDLELQVNQRFEKWANLENGQMIAVLRFAIVAFINELRLRLYDLVRKEKITSANLNVNPIYTSLLKVIEPKIRQRLLDCGGKEWLGKLVDYEEIQDNREKLLEEKQEALKEWKRQTENCWKIINTNDMWFPVINHQGKLKTKS